MSTLRQQMTHDLQLRGLSERTQEANLRAVRQLADYYPRSPDLLEESHTREYCLYMKNQQKFLLQPIENRLQSRRGAGE
jgi:hypothetical protein